ncbi:MAG: bacteriochlorophyll 4-vinyl reductase [Erythrobacter sp.]|uniref:bacteriochlorophyll 4-vinyl reductase n=1 Tax=Erythrobacter sp. TaxID=1042 RepID=UPI0026364060|nr:bacteriochlorophyll 4-vinyl reductase [Erythrobacter sp.]MDJ0977481.1 bacteriochlorophyll 4-vinyl reductase [Erythrobacter sp.]
MWIEGPLIAESDAALDRELDTGLDQGLDARAPALIGPNAILQLAQVMEERLGWARTARLLREAGLVRLPSGQTMIPEDDAVQLHHALARYEGECAEDLVRESGRRTADYIIANRIPKTAAWLLRRLPAPLAARLLMMAIKKHAWTFTGAGHFRAEGPWRFSINRAGSADWREPPASLFAWYEEVFERLFRELSAQDCRCRDTCAGGPPTRVHHYRIDRTLPV